MSKPRRIPRKSKPPNPIPNTATPGAKPASEKPSGSKCYGPKYWRSIWRAAVEYHYGNKTKALDWMLFPWHPLGGRRPVDLTNTAEGRSQIMQEFRRLDKLRYETKPRTAWRTSRSLYPSPFNGCLLFRNTEFPADFLFHHLDRGGNVDGFLREHPGITRAQVHDIFQQIILDLCDW